MPNAIARFSLVLSTTLCTSLVFAGHDTNNYKWSETNLSQKDNQILRACLANQKTQGGKLSLSKGKLITNCVIPYINGAWLSTHWLLRTPEMISSAAVDGLLKKSAKDPINPVYYPAALSKLKEVIAKNVGKNQSTKVTILSLPSRKPVAGTKAGERLYNHQGLLYVPNAYVVAGGMFNELYGWDTYFIVDGLLESAKYLSHQAINHKSSRILVGSIKNPAFKTLTPQQEIKTAQTLFYLAKGIVDDHIFSVDFYGGYVLNGNRSYYLTRSQPPLLAHEALLVYNFYHNYHNKLHLAYKESLASSTAAGKQIALSLKNNYRNANLNGFHFTKNFKTPTSMRDWLAYEVLPASYAYFEYYTKPSLNYKNWIPYTSATYKAHSNPRVTKDKGNYYYTYATDGVGPAPEAINSTQPANEALYRGAVLYFKSLPHENPNHKFWHALPLTKPYQDQLTPLFYQSDRQVRACGYDLSGRFGAEGQLTSEYGNIALTALLYQMASDIKNQIKLSHQTKSQAATIKALNRWQQQTKKTVDTTMWAQVSKKDGLFNNYVLNSTLPPVYHNLPYGTMFYPLWANMAKPSQYQQSISYAIKPVDIHKIIVHYDFKSGEKSGNNIHGHVSEKYVTSFKNSDGKIERRPLINKYGVFTGLVATGNQWDYPNGWAPVNYFAEESLLQHQDQKSQQLAHYIRSAWIGSITDYFAKKGLIVEKYNLLNPTAEVKISHGYSATVIGFGWSNGTFMRFYNLNHNIK